MEENRQAPILQLRSVAKAYSTGSGQFLALDNISMDIYPGEFLGITGKSGAGKTTLLNMISGVSELTAGEVLFNGNQNGAAGQAVSIHTLSEDARALWRGKHLGIVYQSFELMPSLSLIDNVMLPPDLLGSYHPVASKARALELLDLVDIGEHAYKIPAHISGGQKQRVAIARALVNDPAVIIADEPTGNLDSVTAETIFEIFKQLAEQGKTVVMVTHDENLAARFSRRLHIIDGVLGSPPAARQAQRSRRSFSGSRSPLVEPDLSDAADTPAPRVEFPSTDRQQHDHPAVILRQVDKIYESPAGKFQALKSVSMQLNYGQFISIVGKSGSGKSTLLNMITGIDHPTAGEVIVGDQHIYKMSESDRALWRGRNMGVVFQFFQLLPTLTLLENTMLPMDYCKLYPPVERPERALELLDMVGLADHADKLPAVVSSGQQQSAAIARALATDPMLVLADEPTGNLDSRSATKILDLFEQMSTQGKTILIVTHDPSITQRTDQTIILSDGEIIDQTVSRALPFLSHPQMLIAANQAKKKHFKSGAVILRQGKSVDHFFMVDSGEVEVVVNTGKANERSLARLGPGQFFGEIELIQGGRSIASVRAGQRGAQVSILPKEDFFTLIDGSPLTRSLIQQTARTRRAEHRRRKTDR